MTQPDAIAAFQRHAPEFSWLPLLELRPEETHSAAMLSSATPQQPSLITSATTAYYFYGLYFEAGRLRCFWHAETTTEEGQSIRVVFQNDAGVLFDAHFPIRSLDDTGTIFGIDEPIPLAKTTEITWVGFSAPYAALTFRELFRETSRLRPTDSDTRRLFPEPDGSGALVGSRTIDSSSAPRSYLRLQQEHHGVLCEVLWLPDSEALQLRATLTDPALVGKRFQFRLDVATSLTAQCVVTFSQADELWDSAPFTWKHDDGTLVPLPHTTPVTLTVSQEEE